MIYLLCLVYLSAGALVGLILSFLPVYSGLISIKVMIGTILVCGLLALLLGLFMHNASERSVDE